MIEPAAKSRHAYTFKDFSLDLDRGCLWRGAEELRLRPKVFEALKYLVLNDNRLVTKEELISALWPDSFVTDDSLVQCLVELRRALGDEAQACLKTVPRRGYIFTASVRKASASPPTTANAETPAAVEAPRRAAIALLALLVGTAAVFFHFMETRRPARTDAFTDKDSVLIADFVNTTGDDVFDGTLRQAMAVQLGQSPFLNIFSEERVRETLRYMGRPPDEPLTQDLAREIAQRQGVKALLAGSISNLGRHYVINLEAVNAATGETILREQVEAESRERVLGRLGEAAAKFREKLGESVGSIEKFAAPIEQATTPSLEAFKAYDLGRTETVQRSVLRSHPSLSARGGAGSELRNRLRRPRNLLRHCAGGRPGRAVRAARLRAARTGDRAREVLHLGALLHGRARRRGQGHRGAGAVEADLPTRLRPPHEPVRPLLRDRPARAGARGGARGSPLESGCGRRVCRRGARLDLPGPVSGRAGRHRAGRVPEAGASLQSVHAVRDRLPGGRHGHDAAAGRPRRWNADGGGNAGDAVGGGRVRRPGAPGTKADGNGHRPGHEPWPEGRSRTVFRGRRPVGGGLRQLPGGASGPRRERSPCRAAGAPCAGARSLSRCVASRTRRNGSPRKWAGASPRIPS